MVKEGKKLKKKFSTKHAVERNFILQDGKATGTAEKEFFSLAGVFSSKTRWWRAACKNHPEESNQEVVYYVWAGDEPSSPPTTGEREGAARREVLGGVTTEEEDTAAAAEEHTINTGRHGQKHKLVDKYIRFCNIEKRRHIFTTFASSISFSFPHVWFWRG